jgi:hypothetical protein
MENGLTPNDAQGSMIPQADWQVATAIVAACEWTRLGASGFPSDGAADQGARYLVRYAYSANGTQLLGSSWPRYQSPSDTDSLSDMTHATLGKIPEGTGRAAADDTQWCVLSFFGFSSLLA